MYTKVWQKYLPFVRIILKRSLKEEQTFDMNRIDFERAAGGKKAGFRYTLKLVNAELHNIVPSQIAKDMMSVFMQDPVIKSTLQKGTFEIGLNTKCQLNMKCIVLNTPVETE